MHKCDFCHRMFTARPQVKVPKACSQCQAIRRKTNQKAWHFKHKSGFDIQYHRSQKALRKQQLKAMCDVLCHALEVGLLFEGKKLNRSLAEDIFLKFLQELGVRRVNNLWSSVSA
jgi:hypothetical protein